MSSLLSPDRLKQILARTKPLTLEPTGTVVTIMFIDIVGFSVSAEKQTPKEAFMHLKERLSLLTDIVHSVGGVVDKTLGDGLLCFFGYQYDAGAPMPNHADIALQCALRIQRENVAKNLEHQKKELPIYPLRIGINTAAVYIGDIGSSSRIDLTLIGHGVNYAKRLESACELDCIMVGATTYDTLIEREKIPAKLVKRYIQVKNFTDLIEAYECDPFLDNPDVRNQAKKAFQSFRHLERAETRWPVRSPREAPRVHGVWGHGTLINFSESGMLISADKYLGRAVQVQLELDFSDEALHHSLREKGISPMVCEIRWGKPLPDGRFELGLLIKNLSLEQKRLFVAELRRLTLQKPALKISA